jgi:hypothetical protein
VYIRDGICDALRPRLLVCLSIYKEKICQSVRNGINIEKDDAIRLTDLGPRSVSDLSIRQKITRHGPRIVTKSTALLTDKKDLSEICQKM